jgi:TIGR03009 family protein
MSRFGTSILALLVFAAALHAQQEPRARQPDPNPAAQLNTVLSRIEERMRSTESILVQDCVRVDTDVRGVKKTWKGELRFLKPNLFAIRMEQQEDRRMVEMMISTGKYLYEYRPQFKKLMIHELPPVDAVALSNHGMIGLALGKSAASARERYDLRITKAKADAIYIEVAPKSGDDKREFTRAELVLGVPSFAPKRLWFEQPSGGTVEWTLPKFDTQTKLTKDHFRPGPAPEGWETVQVPLEQNQPPRRPGP